MTKSYHSSKTTADDTKKKILRTKANDILFAANKEFKDGIKNIDNIEQRSKEIAAFNSYDIKDVVNNINGSKAFSVFKGYDVKKEIAFATDEQISRPIIESLYKNNFFENLKTLGELKTYETGAQLMEKSVLKAGDINYNLSSKLGATDYQTTFKGIRGLQDVKKNGGFIADFDIESLGGVNRYGHQQLDHITEIATIVNQYAPGGKYVGTPEKMVSMLGFSQDDYNSTASFLETLKSKNPNELTSIDHVYLNRLARTADPNIKYDMSNGLDITITDTSKAISEKDLNASVDEALKGAKKLREFGVHQESLLQKGTSLTDYKKNYVKQHQRLIHQGIGQNGTYKDLVVTGHNIINFDMPQMATYTGENFKNNKGIIIADTLQQMHAVEEFVGEGTFHNNIDLKKLSAKTKMYGTSTQDYARARFNVGDGQAHNALIDVENHLEIALNSDFSNIVNRNLATMERAANGLKGGYKQIGRPGIFYGNKTATLGYGNNKNALSFVYNPLDDTFMSYNGYKVNNKTGEIDKQSFNGWGPKSNALYEKKVYDIDLTADWRKQFEEIGINKDGIEDFYQQYKGLSSIQIVESKEFIDIKKLEEQYGKGNTSAFEHGGGKVYYDIVTNEEELATTLGLKVGYKNDDGSFASKKESIDALGLKKMERAENGDIVVKQLTTNEAIDSMIDRSNYRMATDSGARTIRDGSYTRFQTQRQFGIKNAKDGKRLKMSQIIAEQISKNKDLTMDITTPLIDELGWMTSEGKKIGPERLAKATVVDGYIEKGEKVFAAMQDIFAEMGLQDNYETFTSSNDYEVVRKIKELSSTDKKKDYIFARTLQDTLEEISNNPELISGSAPAVMTKFEANKVDFNTYDIFPELSSKKMRGSVANQSQDITSIGLNTNDGIMRAFIKGKYGSNDVIPHSNAAYDALVTAYNVIGEDPRFEGVWGNLSLRDIEQGRQGNLSVINDKMMKKLRDLTNEKRKTNSGFGYQYVRTVQDPLKQFDLLSGMNESEIKERLKRNFANVDTYINAYDAKDSTDIINDIVNKYFMTFSEDNLEDQIKNLTASQQDIMRSNYKLAKSDATKRATELLGAVGTKSGINLEMVGEGLDSKLIFRRGQDIRDLNIYKYTLNNGVIEAKIGDSHHSVGSAFNTSKMVKNGRVVQKNQGNINISVTNEIENSIDHLTSLEDIVKRAHKGKRDVLEDLVYNINGKRNNVLREALPRREALNYSNTWQRATQVDFNGIVSILPELANEGIIDDIIKRGGVPEEYAKLFKESIKAIKGDGVSRIRGLDEMLSLDKNLLFQLFDEQLPDFINKRTSFKDDITEKVFKNLSNYTKSTQFVKGRKNLDTTPAPHGAARFDKDPRPPVYQYGGTELYDKNEVAKGLALGKKNSKSKIFDTVFAKSNITTAAGQQFIYNVNGNKTSGLTMKYLQMDSNTLRNTLLNHSDKKTTMYSIIDKFGANAEGIINNKIKNMSTYEQQTLMNSRVFDISFHKTNTQAISSKKKLLVDHAETVKLIKELNATSSDLYPVFKDGKIIYTNGIDVKTNQALGLFGDANSPEIIRANHDGLFRTRYYKDGELVNEAQLNSFINKTGLNKNDANFNLDAISAINEEFDKKLEVVKKYQTYGQKAFNDTMEKSTVETLAMSMGSLDNDLYSFLNINEKDSLGKVLSKEYEDILLNKFGDVDINGLSFSKRYFDEKHAFSDFLTGLKGFEEVSQFVALDVFKHQSSSIAITNGLKNLENNDLLKEDVLNRLLGKDKWSMNEESQVFFDNVRQIDMSALTEKERAIFNNLETILDKDNNILGHKGYSHVVQVRDDSAGSYAGRLTKEAIEDGSADSFKGVKFSKNMNVTLKAMKYDNDSFELTKDRYADLGLEDEFNKSFGHVLEKNATLKESYLGKSILEPVTETVEALMLNSPGQKLLSEVKGDSRYSHLIKEYGKNASNISLDRAETAYSYAQGKRSMKFNSNYTSKEYNRLTNELPEHLRFQEIDLTKARSGVADDWLSLDIGGQGNTVTGAINNPYTNNLMIRYGDKEGQVLAIPRMPEAHFDDSVIKSSHIKQLNALQSTMQEMNNASPEEKAKLSRHVEDIAQNIKVLQKKDISSKTGLAGEMITTRMDQAFFGKASGLTYNDINNDSLRDVVKKRKEFGYSSEAAYNSLKEVNSDTLSEAMYNEKSLLRHYSEGKAVDAVFLSEDAFKKMGYFDKDFMQDVFSNMDSKFAADNEFKDISNMTEEKMQKSMKRLLKEHGDSFIAVRYPEIMEGSDTMIRGYLKEDLKDNQIQALAHTGAKMRLDHDGDNLAVARAKNEEGKSVINYLTNEQDSSESLTRYAQAVDASIIKKSVTDNWYWDDQARAGLSKEQKIASLSKIKDQQGMIDAVGKDKMIDGKLISSMLDMDNMTYGDYANLNTKYMDQLKLTASNKGDHSAAVELIKKTDGLNIEDYTKAFAYSIYKDENTAKSANQSIGEINVTNAKIKTAFSSLLDPTMDNYSYAQTTAFDLFHISEEAAISAKSSIEGLDPDRAKKWNSMATQLISGQGNKQELMEGMKDWAKEYTIGDMRLGQYWDESKHFQNKVKDLFQLETLDKKGFDDLVLGDSNKANFNKVGNMVVDDFIENLGTLSDVDNIGKFMNQLSIGQSTNGVIRGTSDLVTIDGVSNNYDSMISAINMMENSAEDFKNIKIMGKMRKETFSNASNVDNIISATERNASKKSLSHAILEGASDIFKGIGSSGLAMGALGIAAGVMALGYVGGRPRPADVQAMEEAQDFQAPMDGHSVLSDPGLSFRQGGSNGYVVNINARTDKGKDHAVSAIQEAISSGTSSSISMSMNINDNYGNMSNKDLENAMADLFR